MTSAKEKFGHDEQIDQGVDKIKDAIPGGEGRGLTLPPSQITALRLRP